MCGVSAQYHVETFQISFVFPKVFSYCCNYLNEIFHTISWYYDYDAEQYYYADTRNNKLYHNVFKQELTN